ncbi:hypothetical protein P0082_09035 [Candidatus Haliotispira prima]|uniref:Uncharacterized protein n=1 Tax=Candidatus Haliotispira prima TaxID=3034016 RepID=A0ABY8MFI2_9SPIO|nr:hypothetical protein P0082_09035 [Candidatus Haliotispira prima]
MDNQKLLETVADFAYILGKAGYFSGDSRADIQEIIYWAKNFEEKNKNTNWNKTDYILEIERYSTNKLIELRSLNIFK